MERSAWIRRSATSPRRARGLDAIFTDPFLGQYNSVRRARVTAGEAEVVQTQLQTSGPQ